MLAPASAQGIQSLLAAAVQGRLPAEPDVLNMQTSVPQAVQNQAAQKSESSTLRLLRRVAQGGATSLESLSTTRRLSRAAQRPSTWSRRARLRELFASKLLGRGGAAFPTAKKWEALFLQRDRLQQEPNRTHYIICNADESEPGTFKDRILMEGDPFAVLEGITIGGFVTGARQGYIYLRGEYPLAAERMRGPLSRLPKTAFSAKHSWQRPANSTLKFAAAPAPISVVKRPRSSTRLKAIAGNHATSRRSPPVRTFPTAHRR